MQNSRDESNRISRLSSSQAQAYLRRLKGPVYERYREHWERCGKQQVGLDTPLQLNVEITASCNLRCRMCYRSYDLDVRNGCLSTDDVQMLANQFEALEIPSLWISGGEPLMHPQIETVLRIFGEKKPVDFWMVTNGLLLTEKIADTIIDSGLTWLSISIDAANADTYRRIRGGDYDKLCKNIETFLKVRSQRQSVLPFLRVSFIKMQENSGEEEEFIRTWSEKADIIDLQTLADYHDLDRFTMEDVINASFRCTAPFTLLSVLPNGDIIPCCNGFYGEKSKTNICNTSLYDYWNSTFHKQFAASVKNKNYCSECIKCVKSFIPKEQAEARAKGGGSDGDPGV